MMHLIKDHNDPIYNEIFSQFIFLSKTEKGLNVVKKLINELKDLVGQQAIIKLVLENASEYIEDFYCNYVIQLIVQCWPIEVIRPVFLLISDKIRQYSLQKSSSNVVETMISCAPMDIKSKYFKEIAEMNDAFSKMII